MVDVAPSRGSSDEDPQRSSDEEAVEAWRRRARKAGKHKRKGSFWRELPILVVVAVGLAFLIQTFLARVYMIPSESMEQTLHGCANCYGDRVLVDKITYDFSEPAPGDVVVFHGPDTWVNQDFVTQEPTSPVARFFNGLGTLIGLPSANEEDFVKRVIAVGGQTVQCCDARNRVVVDGKPLEEPYLYWEPGRSTVQESFAELKIPEGYLFVLGDNRNDSCDSRCQGDGREGGLVPVDNVVGKARVVVLPPSRWQTVSDHNPQAQAIGAPAWQDLAPAGVGFAAAWPVLLLGKRARAKLRRSRLG
ncbi:signal peptidase I [Saccharothrix coeruleofusca]|uniref:Signal peptidase I n=1 Tax=Saccharothrix coeruleofusca TaxID=33919 RepID=A0A918ECB8_9PSEU|nr:signal peptidase I [Saccharothrix coeruleofusca]MBP2338526.1 signal peptidase I [Saccharothrix coeruleofusca]GGP47798.1 signal peptidase I [Saccharothrix coeruleofusca]